MKYLKYLWYLLKHKWFVFLAGRSLGVSFWQLLMHDLSKFTLSEFIPYAYYYYGGLTPEEKAAYKPMFWEACDLHFSRNQHHWEFWNVVNEKGETLVYPMPERYVAEMVADWMGAGRAKTGEWDIYIWVKANIDEMDIHYLTASRISNVLYEHEYYEVADLFFNKYLELRQKQENAVL